jgi:hypothetical protein
VGINVAANKGVIMLDPTWMQRGWEALRDTLTVDDATKREMIQFLLDEGFWDRKRLTKAAAVARWNACMNPGKPEFFKLAEVWALMKRFRRFELLHAIVEDLCFERLKPKATEARRQELLERIAEVEGSLLTLLSAARAELDALDATPAPARLHPAIYDGRGMFSQGDVDPDGQSDVVGF